MSSSEETSESRSELEFRARMLSELSGRVVTPEELATENRLGRPFDDAASLLLWGAPGQPRQFTGEFLCAVVVVTGAPGAPAPTARVYGCPSDVKPVLTHQLVRAYKALAVSGVHDEGERERIAWRAVLPYEPSVLGGYGSSCAGGDAQRGLDVEYALGRLDATARKRARRRLGPPLFAIDEIESHVAPRDADPVLPDPLVRAVAGGARRRAGRETPYYVVAVEDGGFAQIHGILARPRSRDPDLPVRVCTRGAGRRAALQLGALVRGLGEPPVIWVLVSHGDGHFRYRATHDGELAIKYMHVTERRRLNALRP